MAAHEAAVTPPVLLVRQGCRDRYNECLADCNEEEEAMPLGQDLAFERLLARMALVGFGVLSIGFAVRLGRHLSSEQSWLLIGLLTVICLGEWGSTAVLTRWSGKGHVSVKILHVVWLLALTALIYFFPL
jgi:hypothetical protein